MGNAAINTKYIAYPEYKHSGVEWLGNIPAHWKVCRLKYLATIKNGQDYKLVQSDSGFPVMGSGGQFACSTKYMYDQPSVLLGRKGTIDKPLYINEPFWTVDTMYYTEMQKGIDAKYLYYLALTIQFGRYATNTALPSMTQEHLGNYLFSIPDDESERGRITSFLDYETTKIDALLEQQKQLINLLKEKRQVEVSHAVTKGLNSQAPLKDSGVDWLGNIPAHWRVTKIKYVVSLFEQGWSPQCESRQAENNEYGVLKVGCVNNGVFNHIENKALPDNLKPIKNYIVKEGDLLISRANTKDLVGSAAVVDRNYGNLMLCDKLYRLRFTDGILPELISIYLSIFSVREQIELQASGASHSMQNIGQETIKNLPCLVIPLHEANELLLAIKKCMQRYDFIIDKAEQQIQLLKERRAALISAAVTGKIDVRKWQAPIPQTNSVTQEVCL